MSVVASVVEYAQSIARAGVAAALAFSVGTAVDDANRVGCYADVTAAAEKLTFVVGGVTGPSLDRTGSQVIVTGLVVQDSSFTITDNSYPSKTLTFQCGSLTTGFGLVIDTGAQTANRTLSVPVLTGNRTLMVIDQAQTLTAPQTILLNGSAGSPAVTSGALYLYATGTGSNPGVICYDTVNLVEMAFGSFGGTTIFGTITSHALNLRTGNADRLTISSAGLVNVTSTTDATSTTAAAVTIAGGLAVAKGVYIGTFLNVAGGASTTVATIGSNARASDTFLDFNSAAGYRRTLRFASGGLGRWWIGANQVAETGANAGSNLIITALNDAGAEIGDVMAIVRASGGSILMYRPVSIVDVNLILGTTTGTMIGTATTQKLGFWNATPVIQPASASQAAVDTTAATNTTPYGYATQAQADGVITLLNEMRSALVTVGLIKGAA